MAEWIQWNIYQPILFMIAEKVSKYSYYVTKKVTNSLKEMFIKLILREN